MGNELFKNIPSKVGDLVKDVRNGRIGLPDLQRPFVWKDNKVRELFDSMLKGYPIGYIMLWESPADYESKKSTIGDNSKTYEEPKELVIDGQQRLTALVAAMWQLRLYSIYPCCSAILRYPNTLFWDPAEQRMRLIGTISSQRTICLELGLPVTVTETRLQISPISTTPPILRFRTKPLKTMSIITAKNLVKMVTAKHLSHIRI